LVRVVAGLGPLTGDKADERQVLSILEDTGLAALRPGQTLIGDKNYYGRDFEAAATSPKSSAGGVFRSCGAGPLGPLGRCRGLPGFGHPVTRPAPGGLAELPGQLALRQRLTRLDTGAVGGHRGGVDVAALAGGSHRSP
jgi:hypothetical protein